MTTAKRREQIVESLRKSKEAREAFVEAHIEDGISFQIRANRNSRDLSQKDLGALCDMKQTAISRLESGEAGMPNLSTLLRLASAFDVALVVRFAPFSELIDWSMKIAERGIESRSFDHDRGLESMSHGSTNADVVYLTRTENKSTPKARDESDAEVAI